MTSFNVVAETLTALVEEKGADYVYERPADGSNCAYTTPEGAPSCIVGHVIERLNPVAFKKIAKNEWEGDTGEDGAEYVYPQDVNAKSIELSYHVNLGFDDKTWNLLEMAQHYQDAGKPWGQAVESAMGTVR